MMMILCSVSVSYIEVDDDVTKNNDDDDADDSDNVHAVCSHGL